MKRLTQYSLITSALIVAASTQAKIIVVNTADNTDFTAGKTNLVTAINALADGDTINFNISGGGVQTLLTPAGGYPLITKNNVTIDGYTQPGSVPNTNPIHAANNAQIKILLDSRNGNALSMGASIAAFSGQTYSNLGFGNTELAILGFFRGTNAVVRGLAIVSAPTGTDGSNSGDIKSISFCPDSLEVTPGGVGNCGGWRVSGCWFGLNPATGQIQFMPDNVTVAMPAITIAAYRTRNNDGSSTSSQFASPATIGVAKNSGNPRADFNVIITGYGFDSEGYGWRISGNFWNVLPDGMHNFDVVQWNAGAQAGDGYIESGRDNSSILVGTDGDGVNDADEGNVFGGSHAYLGPAYSGFVAMDFYSQGSYPASGHGTNIVIAGNYFGVAVDGVTRFTNSLMLVHSFGGGDPSTAAATVRFGSDFDGVSDALEGNVVYNNYPFASTYPALGTTDTKPPTLFDGTGPGGFGSLNQGVRMSFRGNVTVGNGTLPCNFFNGLDVSSGANVATVAWTNYETLYMVTTGDLVPDLDPTSTFPHLKGTFPKGVAPYTTIILDVYELDPEGWSDGKAFAGADFGNGSVPNALTDGASYTNGFAQGKKYLGSYTVANTGTFDVILPASAGTVTVVANYSADPAGTHNGRVHSGNFSSPGYVLPAKADSVGLTQTVPDVAVWFNTTGNYVTNGFIKNAEQSVVQLGNWEPYVSVLSDSTFLIEANTFANDGSLSHQNNVVALQPADGGAGKVVYGYYGDNGQPFKGQINLSRDNGNPGRVAGDGRYGANKYITECETSLGQLPEFQVVPRWSNNDIYTGINRYAAEQLFSLNPLTLANTPITNAWEYVYGPFVGVMGAGNNAPQCSRTGGRPNFLDNGNVVVMIDDKTAIVTPAPPGEVVTFAIIDPAGNQIKSATLADGEDIFDNMCSYQGGFAIRAHDRLLFYDNNGNMTHSNNVDISSGIAYNTGRNDSTHVAADIRSPYVFIAGRPNGNSRLPVYVSAWDSRTGNFVASAVVTDGDPAQQIVDRVALASDALNRVCVAYPLQPDSTFPPQIAARVLSFNGTSFDYLTHSFYPFVNSIADGATATASGITWTGGDPEVAMTPRQILISAKGTINSTNNPAAGADTGAQEAVYTVVSHPAPVAAPKPAITVTRSGGNLNISWDVTQGLFTVQTTPQVQSSGTVWTDATAGNVVPPVSVPISASNKYVRLVRHY